MAYLDLTLFGTSNRTSSPTGFVPLNFCSAYGCEHRTCDTTTGLARHTLTMHKSMCQLGVMKASLITGFPLSSDHDSIDPRVAFRRSGLVSIKHYWTQASRRQQLTPCLNRWTSVAPTPSLTLGCLPSALGICPCGAATDRARHAPSVRGQVAHS
jgi:hypothetical protein